MIKVEITKCQAGYKSIDFSGHAGFARHGKDIVCAAVSMLVINTINSIEQFCDDDFAVESNEKLGFIHVDFYDSLSPKAELLVNSMMLGLQNVKETYGDKYISLITKEV